MDNEAARANAEAAARTTYNQCRMDGRSVQGAAQQALDAMMPRHRTPRFVTVLSSGTLELVNGRVRAVEKPEPSPQVEALNERPTGRR